MKKSKRNKFSIDQKEQIVRSVLEEGLITCQSVARAYNTSHRLIALWVKSYKVHGRAGLSFKNNIQYSVAFKLGILQEMYSKGVSLHQLSVKYLISPSVLSNWKREYEAGGVETLYMKKGRGRPSKANDKEKISSKTSNSKEEELLKENELLRAENDYLKKLQALIQHQK